MALYTFDRVSLGFYSLFRKHQQGRVNNFNPEFLSKEDYTEMEMAFVSNAR